jgi:hypothetical protein
LPKLPAALPDFRVRDSGENSQIVQMGGACALVARDRANYITMRLPKGI